MADLKFISIVASFLSRFHIFFKSTTLLLLWLKLYDSGFDEVGLLNGELCEKITILSTEQQSPSIFDFEEYLNTSSNFEKNNQNHQNFLTNDLWEDKEDFLTW